MTHFGGEWRRLRLAAKMPRRCAREGPASASASSYFREKIERLRRFALKMRTAPCRRRSPKTAKGRCGSTDPIPRPFPWPWRERSRVGSALRDARAIGRIGLGAVGDVPLLDCAGAAHRPRRVLEQHLLLLRSSSGTGCPAAEVVVVDAMVPMRGGALDRAAAARRNPAGCPTAPRCSGL